MAYDSKCPKCPNARFELVNAEADVPGSGGVKFNCRFVRCSSCKAVVGVLERADLSLLIRELARKAGLPLD